MHLDPGKPRVGTRKVEELEDAERPAGILRDDLPRLDALVDDHQLAGTNLALELRADEVERARLGRDDPVSVEPPETEGTHAARIAKGDQLPFAEPDDGEGTVQLAHRVSHGVREWGGVVRDQCGDDLGVRGGRGTVSMFTQLRA